MANQKDLIKIALFDIDGVLTDGSIYVNSRGEETKKITFEDIDAIFELKRGGIKIGFITGEETDFIKYVKQRFDPEYVFTGCKDKLKAIKILIKKEKLKKGEICYVGDSKKDMDLLSFLDYSFVPSDASDEVIKSSKIVLSAKRGQGVIAEVSRRLLGECDLDGR